MNHGAQEGDSFDIEQQIGNFLHAFGKVLREKRNVREMDVNSLADACGIPPNYIIQWENGEADCDLGDLVVLCLALKIRLRPFLEEVELRLDPRRVEVDPSKGTYRTFWLIVRGMDDGDGLRW